MMVGCLTYALDKEASTKPLPTLISHSTASFDRDDKGESVPYPYSKKFYIMALLFYFFTSKISNLLPLNTSGMIACDRVQY